jgi:hypothetical protein
MARTKKRELESEIQRHSNKLNEVNMQAGERNKIIERKKQDCRAKIFDAE